MNKERFGKICRIYDEVKFKASKFENSMETVFDGDTTIMLTWPETLSGNILKEIVNDCGDSEIGARWFVDEGMDQIRKNGRTSIGIEGEEYSYVITSYEDYYDFITGNTQSLLREKSETVKIPKSDISWGEFIKDLKTNRAERKQGECFNA